MLHEAAAFFRAAEKVRRDGVRLCEGVSRESVSRESVRVRV